MKRILQPIIALLFFVIVGAILFEVISRKQAEGTVAGSMGMTIGECERGMQAFMAYYEKHLARDRCTAPHPKK
jgi:hypothetical protein